MGATVFIAAILAPAFAAQIHKTLSIHVAAPVALTGAMSPLTCGSRRCMQ